MKLQKIEIKNIRSYREETIDFSDGILLFQGDIGSGKSSILYSLEFVLFGGTERGFYDKLMRHGANFASVKLYFRVNDVNYKAFREIKRKNDTIEGGESYIEKEDTKLELSWQEMREEIVDLLSLHESKRGRVETFHMSIYTPQEEMKAILTMSDDSRLESIRKVFNLEDYKRAVDNISIVRKELNTEVTRLKTRAERMGEEKESLEKLKQELEEEEEGKIEAEKELDKKIKERDRKKEEKEKLEEVDDETKEKKADISRLDENIEKLEKDLKEIETKLEDIREGEKKIDTLEEKKDEYEDLKASLEKIKEKVDERESKERELEGIRSRLKYERKRLEELTDKKERADEIEEKIPDLEDELEVLGKKREEKKELSNKISELDGEIISIGRDIKEIDEELQEMQDLEGEGTCPKCKQEITQEHIENIVDELQEESKELEGKAESLKEDKKRLEGELEDIKEEIAGLEKKERDLEYKKKEVKRISEEIQELDELKEKVENFEEKMEKLKEDIEGYEHTKKDVKELEDKIKVLEGYRDEYIKMKEKLNNKEELEEKKDDIEDSLEQKKEKLDSIQEELADLKEDFSEERFEKVKKQYEELIGEINKLEERKKNLVDNISKTKGSIGEKKELIASMRESKKRGKKLERLNNWISGDFKEAIRSMEEHRMMQINRDLEVYFKEWFNEILDDPDINARLDENFAPIVSVRGDETAVSDLSGGERTSVALAYRLAFNTIIKTELGLKSNLLVLDEPTTGFSREQLTRLKDVMEKITADQVIIVSHENEIANLADYEYLVTKEEGVSTVQKVT
ncbi:MAG: AAA family ATPase [Thermoplasmata archaeon]